MGQGDDQIIMVMKNGEQQQYKNNSSSTLGIEKNQVGFIHDDDQIERTGTVWTASAHIITAVIGSGVLSLGWAIAQLGWIAGPAILILFSLITLYTSSMLADCYRTSDPINGKRNSTYMQAVQSNLGGMKHLLCGLCQYANLFGITIGYTITASISAAAISKSNCFHKNSHQADCRVSTSSYIIAFGVVQIFLSQVPNFHKLWWLSTVAAMMSFTYSFIAVGLPIATIVSGNVGETSITGTRVGINVHAAGKIWNAFQALGDIAFAYTFSQVLIEIQDTLRSPPAENKSMKKASLIGVLTTTAFYLLCGCLGYAAFGNSAPGNILTGFGFYEPYWLVDLANVCIVVHLVGAFQVFAQPLFAAVEKYTVQRYPNSKILTKNHPVLSTKSFQYNVNIFRLIWRTVFVIICTLLAIIMPFFNAVLSFLGALGFWPLTVYFPVSMYIAQRNITRFSSKWIALQTLSFLCFLVTVAAACGSIQGVVQDLHHYVPFHTRT